MPLTANPTVPQTPPPSVRASGSETRFSLLYKEAYAALTIVYPVITRTQSDKLHVESNSVVQAQDSDNVYLWICSKGILE